MTTLLNILCVVSVGGTIYVLVAAAMHSGKVE